MFESAGNVELLKELMKRFIYDVKKGISVDKAGWVKKSMESSELDPSFVEKKDGSVRIAIKEDLPKMLRDISREKEVLWLAELCLDMNRMGKARELLVDLVGRFEECPQLEGSIIALGWSRMLKGIRSCVVLDRLLEEGLNAVEWCTKAPKASVELAISLTKKWWEVNLTDIEETSKSLGISFSPSKIDPEFVEKVKRVLDWHGALNEFTREESEALGLLWFVDALLISNEVYFAEAFVPMKKKAWEVISERIGKEEIDILEWINEVSEKLRDRSRRSGIVTVDWAQIIRLPW